MEMIENNGNNKTTLKQRWNKVTGSESNNNDFNGLDGQLPGFPGYLLRQAREDKGLQQVEVARELHLTSRVLEGLENDDFSHVNGPIFARGYIRSYSRYLGLDPDSMVAEYDSVYGRPDNAKKPMSPIRHVGEQARPGDTWVKLVSVLIVLALVAASWWWWQGQQDSAAPTSVSEVTVQDSQGQDVQARLPEDEDLDLQLGTLSNPDNVVGATDEAAPSATQEAPASEPEAGTDNDQADPVSVAKATPEAQSEQPAAEPVAAASVVEEDLTVASSVDIAPGQGLLLLEFKDDCWVEIQDGNGTMVLADLKTSGQVIEMAVQAPVQLLLGRASAISNIAFAQRSIDLEPHTRKDIARVTLEL